MSEKDKRINKSDFLSMVASDSGVDEKVVRLVYASIVKLIAKLIVQGCQLTLTGFGTFVLKTHKGHRIQFGDTTKVDSYHVVSFKASDAFKQVVYKCLDECDTCKLD